MDAPVPLPDLLESTQPDGERIHRFDVSLQQAPSLPSFAGLHVLEDFLDPREERELLETLEREPFNPSQSGKDKQHYGPRINFNKRRMNPASFEGLPAYAHAIERRVRERLANPQANASADLMGALSRFETTDVFVLRYAPERSSNLDFHLDDTFGYGEMILDLSLESPSWLTFYRGRQGSEAIPDPEDEAAPTQVCVRCPLPPRSLAILFGPARFHWEHAILASDIFAKRTSITMRTLGDALRETDEGREVLERARASV